MNKLEFLCSFPKRGTFKLFPLFLLLGWYPEVQVVASGVGRFPKHIASNLGKQATLEIFWNVILKQGCKLTSHLIQIEPDISNVRYESLTKHKMYAQFLTVKILFLSCIISVDLNI